jgi:DNA-binding Lrp family transcriptional regulator
MRKIRMNSGIPDKIPHPLDEVDRKLLRALQQDAGLTAQQLGDRLNLSPSQAARRRQRLEQTGIITGSRAIVAPEALGLGVQAFIQVEMGAHSAENAAHFARLTRTRPEITAAFTLTGEADYLLRVWCADLQALHQLVQTVLLPHPAVARVQSRIVMDQLKPDAPLPV